MVAFVYLNIQCLEISAAAVSEVRRQSVYSLDF